MIPSLTTILDPQRPTLLLALHPAPSAAVLSGQKILEFRKRFYPHPFQAFVYTTGQGIQSFIRCGAAYQGTPAAIARLGAAVQGSDVAATLQYLGARPTAMAIPIEAVYQLEQVVTLADLRRVQPRMAIPQTYTFLNRAPRLALLDFLTHRPCVLRQKIEWSRYAEAIRDFQVAHL